MSDTETVTTYRSGDQTYEIDHLGICHPETQWGEFAVYRDGEQLAEFAIPGRPGAFEYWPPAACVLPPHSELVRLAREAVALNEAVDIA